MSAELSLEEQIREWLRPSVDRRSLAPWEPDIASWAEQLRQRGYTRVPHPMGRVRSFDEDRAATLVALFAGQAGERDKARERQLHHWRNITGMRPWKD